MLCGSLLLIPTVTINITQVNKKEMRNTLLKPCWVYNIPPSSLITATSYTQLACITRCYLFNHDYKPLSVTFYPKVCICYTHWDSKLCFFNLSRKCTYLHFRFGYNVWFWNWLKSQIHALVNLQVLKWLPPIRQILIETLQALVGTNVYLQ